jgi:geranylgeranyl reductase family protein
MAVSDSHDILIVGAGPAGSTLGYLLAASGLDVLVLDKSHFPRPKLCGGVLTWKTRKVLEEVFKVPFTKGFPIEDSAEDYVIYENYKQKVFQSSPEPFYFIDREKYDATLVSLAQEKGCQFQFGQQATEIDFQSGSVKTQSREIMAGRDESKGIDTDLRENRFEGKTIVGADGVNSVVRARLFPEMDFHRNSGLAFQIKIPVDEIKAEYRVFIPQVFLGGIRCGYGWIFPHGVNYTVGLWGLISKDKKVKEKYLDFLSHVTDVDVEKLSHLPAHLGPAGNFMESPGDGNALLVGDAAGFADSLTGEGIYYAHKSAECAANAIVDYFQSGEKNVLLASYKSYLAPTIKELKISLRFRNLVYSNLRKIGFFILRSPGIYSKLSAVVHGTKSYTQLPFISR